MFKKIIFVLALGLLFTSCCTCSRTGADNTVLEYQRQVDELKEQLRSRDRAIENSIKELEYITSRSEGMGGEIEDIIRELDLYQSAVERLLLNYRTAASEIKNQVEVDNLAVSDSSN